ncbi:hypothetical protein RB596_000312 [Gaeumannomyces avenae]
MDPPATTVPGSQQPPPSTQGTNPISSGVIEQYVENLRKEKGVAVEAAASGSTEATNPVSSGAIERLLEERRREKDAHSSNASRADGGPAGDEAFPITQLATEHLLCRILIIEEQGALQVPGAERIQVRREVDSKGDGKDEKGDRKDEKGEGKGEGADGKDKGRDEKVEGDGTALTAECLAVTQRQNDICCRIESPVQCELYYDSQRDSIQAVSDEETEIRIELIAAGDEDGHGADEQPEKTRILKLFDRKPIGPGAWRLSSVDVRRSIQIIIFPRRHSLTLVKLKTLSAIARTKRDAPPESQDQVAGHDTRQEDTELEPVASSEIIKRLDSLAELSEGQMLHVINTGTKEYSLFRMALLGKTRSAQVFQAKHSKFPDKLVVVKAFMYADRYNAVDRGRLWKAEYSIHRKLKSDVIVELFGADARLEALIMDSVDARNLGSGRWCDIKGNKHFLGTRVHAVRVLADMFRALLHLRQKGVLHNDIKPSNILFSEQRGAVLIDFGLATLDGSLTSTGGTPWYVPREYMDYSRRAAPADVWALGVVVAYLLGHMPLPDSERQVKSWLIRNIARPRPDPLLPPSPAQARMIQWLDIVEAIRLKLLRSYDDDWLIAVVAGMLSNEKERMTAEDLASVAANLTLNMAG